MMMKVYLRGSIALGPKISAALAAVPRTKSGEPDKRYAATKKVLEATTRTLEKPVRQGGPFEQEVSRRPFPLAIRPVRVVRADGSWMSWDRYIACPDVSPIHSMVFEDGKTVLTPHG
jgi:hypothetical protein